MASFCAAAIFLVIFKWNTLYVFNTVFSVCNDVTCLFSLIAGNILTTMDQTADPCQVSANFRQFLSNFPHFYYISSTKHFLRHYRTFSNMLVEVGFQATKFPTQNPAGESFMSSEIKLT